MDVGPKPNHVNIVVNCVADFYIVVTPRESIRSDPPPMICRESGYKGLTQEAPSSQSIPHKNNEPLRPSKRCPGEYGSVRRKATLSSKGKLFDLYNGFIMKVDPIHVYLSEVKMTHA